MPGNCPRNGIIAADRVGVRPSHNTTTMMSAPGRGSALLRGKLLFLLKGINWKC